MTNVTIPAVELDTVVYSTDDFAVSVTEIHDAETKQPLTVYGIFNRSTGVREAELRGYSHAVQWANQMQKAVNDAAEAEEQEKAILAAMPTPAGDASAYSDDEVLEYELPPKDVLADVLNGAAEE